MPPLLQQLYKSLKNPIGLIDNKPVFQAAGLLKKGKFSSSTIINNVLSSMADLNLKFQHVSEKLGQNIVDNFASRNPVSCGENKDNCQICSFINDCSNLTVGSISFKATPKVLVGLIDIQNIPNDLINQIIRGEKSVPFNNRGNEISPK